MAKSGSVRVTKYYIEGETAKFQTSMNQAGKSADNFAKRAKNAGAAANGASTGFKNAANSASIMLGPLNGVSGRLSSMATAFGALNPLIVASGIAISSFGAFMFGAVKASEALFVEMARLDAVLKTTGFAAGVTSKQINDMARDIGRDTLASAAGVRAAALELLTFKSIAGEAFEDTLRLAQDMTTVFRTDLKGATLILGKALEDPLRGMSALSRTGVTFTEAERDMIKELEEAGDLFGQQAILVGKLRGQIEGAGEAGAGGLVHATDSFAEAWTNMLEVLGQGSGLGSVFTKVTDLGTLMADQVADYYSATPAKGPIKAREQALQDHINLLRQAEKVAKAAKAEAVASVNVVAGVVASIDLAQLRGEIALSEKQLEGMRNQLKAIDATNAVELKKQAKAKADSDRFQAAEQDKRDKEALDKRAKHQNKMRELIAISTQSSEQQQRSATGGQEIEAERSRFIKEVFQTNKKIAVQADGQKLSEKNLAAHVKLLEQLYSEHYARLGKIQRDAATAEQDELDKKYRGVDAALDKVFRKEEKTAEQSQKVAAKWRNNAAKAAADAKRAQDTDLQAAEDARFQRKVAKAAEEFELTSAMDQADIENKRLYYATLSSLHDEYIERTQGVSEDEANLAVDRLTHIQDSYVATTQASLSSLQELSAAGSREARALVVLQRATSIAQALMSIGVGKAKATEGEPYTMGMRIAAVTAVGLDALAMIKSAGTRALGGQVTGGNPYFVGERGMEMFIPHESGSVVPANKLDGMGGEVTVNVQNYGAQVDVNRQGDVINLVIKAAAQNVFDQIQQGTNNARSMEKKYALTRRQS